MLRLQKVVGEHSEKNIAAISFAEIASGQLNFKGISKHDVNINGFRKINQLRIKSDKTWDEHIENWRDLFLKILKRYEEGDAAVQPTSTEVCQHCQLQTFCRIKEENIQPCTRCN